MPPSGQHIDETFIDHLNLYEKRLVAGKSNVHQTKRRLNDAELAYNLYPNENEPAEVTKWNEKVHRILEDRDGNKMQFPNIQTIMEEKKQQELLKEQEEERKKLEWSLRYKYVAYNDGNKKTSKLSEKTLAGLKEIRKNKRFGQCTFEFGPRLEGEQLRVIENYQGVNSEYIGKRTLIRKDAKFSASTSALPPWIGPGHYSNYDPEYFKERPASSYQVTFKSIDRSVPPVGDIESLKLKETILHSTVDFDRAMEYELKQSRSPSKPLLSPIKTSPSPKPTGLVKDYTYDALASNRKVTVMDVPNIADYLDDQGRVVSDVLSTGKKGRKKAVKVNFQIQNIEEAAEYLASLRATENAHTTMSADANSVASAAAGGGALADSTKNADENDKKTKNGKFSHVKSKYLDHPLLRKPPPLFEKPPLTEEEIAEKAARKALMQEKAKVSKAKYDEILSSVPFGDDIEDIISDW